MPQSQHSSIWIRRAIHAALAATTAGALTAVPAIAQDESAAGLEEVVVTARKRAESLQDVPVAVTALTAGMIERGNLNTVVDVAKMAPNVELIAQPFAGSALAASIRGAGLDDLEKTFEPTVAVSVDGVFYPQRRVPMWTCSTWKRSKSCADRRALCSAGIPSGRNQHPALQADR